MTLIMVRVLKTMSMDGGATFADCKSANSKEDKAIRNAIFRAKLNGLIVRNKWGRYTITDNGKRKLAMEAERVRELACYLKIFASTESQ